MEKFECLVIDKSHQLKFSVPKFGPQTSLDIYFTFQKFNELILNLMNGRNVGFQNLPGGWLELKVSLKR